MRFLSSIGVAIVIVLAVLLGAAYLLPQHVEVEASVDIDAPPSAVYPIVADLRNFNDWSPWAPIDPNMSVSFPSPEPGIGQAMTFASDNPAVGAGTLTVTGLDPDRVDIDLDFGPQGGATMAIHVGGISSNRRARVTWTFGTDLGNNPIARYVWPLAGMSNTIQADYDRGLDRLKTFAEAQVAAAAPAVVAPVAPVPAPAPVPPL